jgi:hypothetical protein
MKRTLSVTSLVAFAAVAWADSISPLTFSDTIAVGESTTVTKTVTVSTELTTAKVDVFFIVDTTGSMGEQVTAAKNAISTIISNTSALGDIAYGVGYYEDFPNTSWGGGSDKAWEMLQDITTDTTAVTTGINALSLGWGRDFPESNLHGLKQMADTASWRPGSKRIAFWFGDAPGHDPNTTPGYPGPTLAAAIAALTGKNIQVEALNSSSLNSTGQATAITAATGGTVRPFGASPTVLSEIVKDALDTSFSSYANVSLDLSEVPAGLIATSVPGSYVGSWTRDTEETFTFDLTFEGVTPGTYTFDVYGLVDGVRTTLPERDRIVVTGDGIIPEPSMGIFGGMALLLGFLGFRRNRR